MSFAEVVPGIIVGSIVACITSYMALQRLLQEKWWNRQAAAYTRLIEALCDAVQFCEVMRDKHFSGGEDAPAWEVTKDQYKRAVRRIQRASNAGAFAISDTALHVVREIEFPRTSAWKDMDAEILYDGQFEQLKTALEKIRTIASRELRKPELVFGEYSY